MEFYAHTESRIELFLTCKRMGNTATFGVMTTHFTGVVMSSSRGYIVQGHFRFLIPTTMVLVQLKVIAATDG